MKFQKGGYVSLTNYFKVLESGKDSLLVEDRDGETFELVGEKVLNQLFKCDSFDKTIKTTKQEIVEKLQGARSNIFTVKFKKADGEDRVLVGYLHSVDSFLGRTNVIDVQVPADDKTKGHRLIDNRNIEWLIIDNTKYTTK